MSGGGVGHQIILMDLRAAHQDGGDAGDADAAADVAHQVVDAGGVTHFFLAQSAHGHGGEGDEDEAAGEAVDDVRQGDGDAWRCRG